MKIPEGRKAAKSPTPKNNWRLIFLAFRPWSFYMTGISIMTGSLAALLAQNLFNPFLAALVLLGVIAIHASANILNDYFDTLYGIDRPGNPTTSYRPHPLLEQILSPREIILISLALIAAALLVAVYFTMLRGWTIAALALIGISAGIAYTAGPIKYKYHGLGEVAVFFIWGPLMIFGAYFVQTGNWSGAAAVLFISVPVGLLVALVLLANNLRDVEYDTAVHIKTVVFRMGKKNALNLFAAMILCTYLFNGLGILFGFLPIWAIWVYLSVPQALRLVKTFYKESALPQNADPLAGRLALTYGALLILSLLMESFYMR